MSVANTQAPFVVRASPVRGTRLRRVGLQPFGVLLPVAIRPVCASHFVGFRLSEQALQVGTSNTLRSNIPSKTYIFGF